MPTWRCGSSSRPASPWDVTRILDVLVDGDTAPSPRSMLIGDLRGVCGVVAALRSATET
jgi:hypothetical protein